MRISVRDFELQSRFRLASSYAQTLNSVENGDRSAKLQAARLLAFFVSSPCPLTLGMKKLSVNRHHATLIEKSEESNVFGGKLKQRFLSPLH